MDSLQPFTSVLKFCSAESRFRGRNSIEAWPGHTLLRISLRVLAIAIWGFLNSEKILQQILFGDHATDTNVFIA